MPNTNEIHHGFPPLCGVNPRILILGTFPSPVSREKGEYYGNVRNQFWRIIYGVFDVPFCDEYSHKTALLHANGVAVWDVIAKCEAVSMPMIKCRKTPIKKCMLLLARM